MIDIDSSFRNLFRCCYRFLLAYKHPCLVVGIAVLIPLKSQFLYYAATAVHTLPQIITRVIVAVIWQDLNYYDITTLLTIIGTDSNITSDWTKIEFKELQTIIVG